MNISNVVGLVLSLIVSVPPLTINAQTYDFVDPAPPIPVTPDSSERPEAVAQEELTFHAVPKQLSPDAVTHDWKTFLGPSRNGISTETHLLKAFGESGPKVVWEVRKGEGYASPAVVGDQVILFHRVGNQERVECLDANTGKRYWMHEYETTYGDRYGFSNGPRCQPVSDGVFVYTCGVGGILSCLDLKTGQMLWQRNLSDEFDLLPSFFGFASTPLIEGDKLIVNIGGKGGPCVAAFDKYTGEMQWGAGDKWGRSYASPVAADTPAGRRVFVYAGGESRPPVGGLLVIDPSNGDVETRFPWRGNRYESVNASSPLVVGDQVYISESYGAGGVLLDFSEKGEYEEIWRNKRLNTHFMTALHKDGYLYGIDGHGPRNAPFVCIELATGKEMWRAEPGWAVNAEGSNSYDLYPGLASLMLVDGRCLVLGQYGHLAWIDLNPDGYIELERTQLFFARQTWGMPALSRGLLYVCQNDKGIDGSDTRLICYDLRASE